MLHSLSFYIILFFFLRSEYFLIRGSSSLSQLFSIFSLFALLFLFYFEVLVSSLSWLFLIVTFVM